MKKAISLLLAILMVMSVIPTAFAETATATFTVTANTQEAKVGDIIEVTVNLANNPGINSFRAKLDFDKTVLKFTGLKEEDDMLVGKLAAFTAEANTNAESEAYGTVGGIRTSNSTANGDFFVALFEVIGEGNVTVGLDVQEFASVADDGTTTSSQPTVTPTEEITATKKEVVVNSLTLKKTSLVLVVGAEATLLFDIDPVTATGEVTWETSDPEIVTVNNGDIKAVKAGEAVITAKAGDKESSCTVKVKEETVVTVTVDGKAAELTDTRNPSWKFLTIEEGQTLEFTVTGEGIEKVSTGSTGYVYEATTENGKATLTTAEIVKGQMGDSDKSQFVNGFGMPMTDATNPLCPVYVYGDAESKAISCVFVEIKPAPETPAVESINLSQNTAELLVGGSLTLTADLLPEGAEAEVEWTTSDAEVATVENGVVTAVAEGTATITAKVGEITATCEVTVTPKKAEPWAEGTLYCTVDGVEMPITWNSWNDGTVTVPAGKDITFKLVGKPIVQTYANLKHNNHTANEDGSVTFAAGFLQSGKWIQLECDTDMWTAMEGYIKVNIVDGYEPAADLFTLVYGGERHQLLTSANNAEADTAKYKAVSAIPDGEDVTFRLIDREGAAREDVTVKTADGEAWDCEIDAKGNLTVPAEVFAANVTGNKATDVIFECDGTEFARINLTRTVAPVITIEPTAVEIMEGKTAELKATVGPENAEFPAVVWSSSKETIATVDAETGVVTANNAGECEIYATVNGVKATCTVTVTPKPEPIITITTADGEELELETYDAYFANNTGYMAVLEEIDEITITAKKELTNYFVDGSCSDWIPGALSEDKLTLTITKEQLLSMVVTKEAFDAEGGTNDPVYGSVIDYTYLDDTKNHVIVIGLNDSTWYGHAYIILEVPVVEATGITLDQTELTLNVGEEATVIATVEPADATFQDVVWETESSRIAEVAEDGTIKANAKGTTTITATIGEFTAECVVTVNEVPVESITLDKTEATSVLKIQSQGKLKLTATVLPANATNKFVEWYSDDESIATVDENGVVTGNKVGKTTIHALVDDNGTEYKASCEVEVIWPFVIKAGDQVLEVVDTGKTTSCAMYRTGNVLKVVAPAGTKEVVIEAVEGANFKAFKDHNSFSAVANIHSGNSYTHKVNGLKGSVCFNGTTIDNFTVHVEIEVEPTPVETVEITGETALLAGEQTTLTATVLPADASFPTVTWTSSDETVATVDSNGVVTAVMEGTAIITATADEVEATVEITVTPKYEIVVEFNKDEFVAGETATANVYIKGYGEKDTYANAFGYALKFNHEDFSFRGGEAADGFDAEESAYEDNIVERRITVVAGKEVPAITEEGILIDTLTFIAIEDGAVSAEFTKVEEDADFDDCEVYAWVPTENGSVPAVAESEIAFVRIVADDKEAANEIDAIIVQMGDKIEYADFAIMAQAREAYDNADEEVKSYVTKLNVLEEVEKYHAFWLSGDIMLNGVINAQDLSTVLSAYGEEVTEQNAFININVEGNSKDYINAGDLSTVLANYGRFIEK